MADKLADFMARQKSYHKDLPSVASASTFSGMAEAHVVEYQLCTLNAIRLAIYKYSLRKGYKKSHQKIPAQIKTVSLSLL